jgi:hypothetical protein
MNMETPNTPGAAPPQTTTGPSAAAAVATRPNGPVAAVMLATGIGVLVLGILTTITEASEGLHEFLEFSERVGPLSGKTIFGAVAFLVSWGGLHLALREREMEWRTVTIAMVAMVAAGFVLTFPPFFQLFESE